MYINDSTIALASEHRLASTSRRQNLLTGEAQSGSRSFENVLNELKSPDLPEEPRAPQGEIYKALEYSLTNLIQMLLGLADSTKALGDLSNGMGATSRAAPQLELVYTRETESCSFSASGNVCLPDGSKREFDVSYEMERSEESTQLSLNGKELRDPLVVDLGRPSNRLSESEVSFDLDADGKTESIRMPDRGSAFLFRDINGNGKADDGRELFGPQSGDGFAELALLDSNGNQWIDEGDAAFASLMLWQTNDEGNGKYVDLATAGIGALSTQSADTPFTIKDKGTVVGQARSSGVWLGEEGGAGTLRQIDLAVSPAPEKLKTQTG